MSSLLQIHCHCSAPASQHIFEHLKSVLSAEKHLNWAAFHLKNSNNNNNKHGQNVSQHFQPRKKSLEEKQNVDVQKTSV